MIKNILDKYKKVWLSAVMYRGHCIEKWDFHQYAVMRIATAWKVYLLISDFVIFWDAPVDWPQLP